MTLFLRLRQRRFFETLPGCVLLVTLAVPPLASPPSVRLTSEQDHRRMLGILRSTSLREAPDAAPKSPNHANFNESTEVANLSLPDPLDLTAPTPQVALTFDDLPLLGPLPNGMTRVEIARKIIRALQAAHAPSVYGFVNAKALQTEPASEQVLREWRAAGFPLANHTFSHMDLNANSVENFEHDILANESTLAAWMRDGDWHWLRYPFLREGNTSEKHRAVLAFLKEHGYKTAQVTISFGDYAYNDPYARCLANRDHQGVEHLKKEYLRGAAESLEHSSVLAKAVFGRDIKHVLLLHIGSFESVMLPHLLDLLKERGYRLVTLPEAQSDPAYAMHPDLDGNWEGSFLDQFVRARHLSVPADLTNPRLVDLDAVCR
jgi:peptidoglycan/xylan/chitin deacetylase (PgdA/CDA1 family)